MAAGRADLWAPVAGGGRARAGAPLAALAALALAGSGCIADSEPKLREGDHYPHFAAVDINGTAVTDAGLKGKVALVHYLETRYPTHGHPSANETFRTVWDAMQDLSGHPVQVVTVGDEDSTPLLASLRAQYNVTWPMVADDGGRLDRAFGFAASGDYDVAMMFGKDGRLAEDTSPGHDWIYREAVELGTE